MSLDLEEQLIVDLQQRRSEKVSEGQRSLRRGGPARHLQQQPAVARAVQRRPAARRQLVVDAQHRL